MHSFMELIVVLVILVIVFGAKTLPAIGEAIGRWRVRARTPTSGTQTPAPSPEPRNRDASL